MELTFKLKDIQQAAQQFNLVAAGYSVFALHGEMGAGKTTFVQAVCNLEMIMDTVSSPTYSIINQYVTKDGKFLYHIDLYRLKNEAEAINAGVEDYLYSGCRCFVEWPEKAPGIFPENTLHLTLTTIDSNTRKLKINL